MSQLITLLILFSMIFGTISGDEVEENGKRWAYSRVWFSMSEEQRPEAPAEIKAEALGMTVDEFILFSKTVEAESDRSGDDIEGRTLIALTILNRVNDPRFEDDITSVIMEGGQFEVYETGAVYGVSRTSLSDQAIINAFNWLAEGDAPNVLFFNNSGYTGEAYGYYGGNYFTLG